MRLRLWAVSIGLLLGACSGDDSVVGPSSTLSSVDVRLQTSSIPVASTTQAFATLKDAAGRTFVVTGDTVDWASSNTDVAIIDKKTGAVTAMSVGTTNISATLGSKSGSAALTVTEASPTQLPVASIDLSIQSPFFIGQAVAAIVVMKDSNGNELSGRAATWTTTDPSIASVSQIGVVTGMGVGTATIRVTSEGVTAEAPVTVVVEPTPAASLNVQTQPAGAVSGVAFTTQPVVQILNSVGDVDAGSTLAVTAVLASGNGTLSGTTTVNAVAGVATFTDLAVTGSGAQVITFSTTSPVLSVASNGFTVAGVPASQLAITTQPSATAQNGVAFAQQPTLQLRDASGKAVGQSGVVVTATIATGGGTLGGTVTATTNASGAATFANLSLTGTPGNRTLSFSATGLTAATSNAIALGAGVATQLVLTTQPSAVVTSGTPFGQQPVVQITDAGGNSINQPGTVITVAASDATLGGTATATTNANGAATFTNLVLTGSGSATLTFSASGLTATTASVLVTPPDASSPAKITITTQPSSSAANGAVFAQQPAIQLRDADDAPVSQSGVSVVASIASGGGTLNGTKTVATNASGAATFSNLSITGSAGPRTLRFTVSGLPTVTSGTVTITAGAATKLGITTQPSSSAQNTVAFAQQPVVQLRDASNNPVAKAGVNVTVSASSGTLNGTKTVQTDANGVATFSGLSITGSTGSRTLSFASTGLTSVTSSSVSLTAGPATKLSISQQPSASVLSGAVLATQPKVQLRDVSNNNVAQSGVQVTVAINSGTGVLGGAKTVATDANGVAAFSGLTITGIGAHVLVFTAPSLTQATTNAISVTGVPTQLGITTQPSPSAVSGAPFVQQPAIQLRDVQGGAVGQAGVVVTASIATGGGTLGGTATATTNASGLATFSNLSITGADGDRTITFTAPLLTSATSSAIAISAQNPGGLYPNRPSTFTHASELDFSQSIPSLPDNIDRPISGTDWNMIYFSNNWSKASDANAPQSAPGIWQGHWAPGSYGGGVLGQGSGHGIGNVFTYAPAGTNRLYMSLRVYFDFDPSQWHPISNKFVNLEGDHSLILMQLMEGGNWRHAEELGASGYSSFWVDDDNAPGQVNNRAVPNRQWTQIEILIDIPNHIYKIWQDGVLTTNASPNFSSTRINAVGIYAFRGGGGETLSTDLYYKYDHFFIAW